MTFWCPKCENPALTYNNADCSVDCKCSNCGHTWTENAPGESA
ncbi:MAG: hypothetical protein OXK17_08320 [Thaumarchaeota archaeon]|nr:hypothetical protein [Nitrososphaerota archaeon]